MTRKDVLDLGRKLSEEHRLTVHGWGVAMYEGRLHLALYLYRGGSSVEMHLVHQFNLGTDPDEPKMLATHLNQSRGMADASVDLFVQLHSKNGNPSGTFMLAKHLHP